LIFNGKNLDGWITGPDNAWLVKDGVLTLKRQWDGKEHNADYLWTEKQYGDFVLDLEFKVADDTNSGIFLRTADRANPVYTGIEMQVSNTYGRDRLSRGGTVGAIYDCLAPTKNLAKPAGQWNRCQITCQGSRIVIVLNGEKVIDMDLDRWDTPQQNPDGTSNKFPTALKDFVRRGHIGFQDHGRQVWYRNIWIKTLDGSQP
jgi:hypothetical protein